LSAAHPLDVFAGGYSSGSVAPAPTIVGGATPSSSITDFSGSSYSSGGSFGSTLGDLGGSFSNTSFTNFNSTLGDYIDPAFDSGGDQRLASALQAYEQQQSLAFYNQIVGAELKGIAQAHGGSENLNSYALTGIDIATEFHPVTAGVKSLYNNGSVIVDSSASLSDKAYAAGNIAFDFLGGKILKKGIDLVGAGAGAARKALGYTDNVVESGVRNAPTSTPHISAVTGRPVNLSGRVQGQINVANGRTRFTPLRQNGNPVSAGFDHVTSRHFNGANSSSQFTTSQSELKSVLQSRTVTQAPVTQVCKGAQAQFVRNVDVGKTVGRTRVADGAAQTSRLRVHVDEAGNLITAFPVP